MNRIALSLMLTAAFAVVAVLLGAFVATRLLRSQARLAAQLREARARSQCLEPLLDVWLWQSDAVHRVVSLKPPHGAQADTALLAPAEPPLLWEICRSTDPAGLQTMLTVAAPLDDLDVQLAAAGAVPRRGVLRGRAHFDEAGSFAGYHGTFAERVLMPVPLLMAARVDAAARHDDQEAFNFTVSHDLRAPVRVVEGFAKILKEDYSPVLGRIGNDHLDRVLGAAVRMNDMIDALLGLSRVASHPLARHEVDLSQLAGFVAEDLRRQWPEHPVELEIEPGLQAQGDPTLLRVVLENLLGNAWKYTARTAMPRVSFLRHAEDSDAFTVRDNGAGFDMRFADRLFGVFQRLHSANEFPGTGVGLASVRRIVRRHGGEVSAGGEPGHGAAFHFSLPQQPARRATDHLPRPTSPHELRSTGGGYHAPRAQVDEIDWLSSLDDSRHAREPRPTLH
jgi:signal transduction histidine kinase